MWWGPLAFGKTRLQPHGLGEPSLEGPGCLWADSLNRQTLVQWSLWRPGQLGMAAGHPTHSQVFSWL